MYDMRSERFLKQKQFIDRDCSLLLGDYKDRLDDVNRVHLFPMSPPYNIGAKKGKPESINWRGITGYDDDLPEDVYQEQQNALLRWCAERLLPTGVIVYVHKPRHRKGQLIKPEEWIPWDILEQHDEVIWDRGSTHNHTPPYVWQTTERLYVLKHRDQKIWFQNEGYRDVWQIPPAKKNPHNAPFPLELARRAIRLWCPSNGLVCDPYCGSGTSMIASRMEDRRFVGSEILPKYFDLAVRRYQDAFNLNESTPQRIRRTVGALRHSRLALR